MKNLDQLFQQKLKNYGEKPSEEAWAKINGKLNRRRKGWFFKLSIAASITAILVIGSYLYVQQDTKQETVALSEEKNIEEIEDSPKPDSGLILKQQFMTDQMAQQNEQAVSKKPIKDTSKIIPERALDKIVKVPDLLTVTEYPDPLAAVQEEIKNQESQVDLNEGNPIMASATDDLPPVVITYRRSLPTANTQVIDENEKENSLGKVILLAQDIKNSGFGLSDLRQAKDNLLDIDLRRIESIFKTN